MIDVTKIKIYMLLKDTNLTSLANELDKPKSTIHRWFTKRNMPVKYAEKIVKILGIPKEEVGNIFFDLN